VTAGRPTSTDPMTRPNPSDATATVRIPGRASAPSRGTPSRAGDPPTRRAGGLSANPAAPITIPVPATARPRPGHGAATRNAAIAGPRMKKTSRLMAS